MRRNYGACAKFKCMNTSDKLSNFTAGHSYKMVLCSHTLLHKLTSVGKEAGRRRTLKRGTGVCTKRRNAIAEAVDRIALYCVLRTDCCCWLDWLSLLYRWFRLAPLNQGFFNVGFTFLQLLTTFLARSYYQFSLSVYLFCSFYFA